LANTSKTIGDWCGSLNLKDVLAKLGEAECPNGPIYDAADMVADPHFQARGMFEDVETVTGVKFQVPALAPRLSETPGNTEWAGPQLGQHTVEVCRELSFTDSEIATMKENKAIGDES